MVLLQDKGWYGSGSVAKVCSSQAVSCRGIQGAVSRGSGGCRFAGFLIEASGQQLVVCSLRHVSFSRTASSSQWLDMENHI